MKQEEAQREKKRKRKRKEQAAPQHAPSTIDMEDDSDAEFSSAPSAIESALSDDFIPAKLAASLDINKLLSSTSSSTPSPPLILFQFPAKFDVAAFSQLTLSLPMHSPVHPTTDSIGIGSSKVVSHFELNGERFSIIEGESSELSDLINLFPSSSTSRGSLTPGRPFTRLLQIISDIHSSSSASLTSSVTQKLPCRLRHPNYLNRDCDNNSSLSVILLLIRNISLATAVADPSGPMRTRERAEEEQRRDVINNKVSTQAEEGEEGKRKADKKKRKQEDKEKKLSVESLVEVEDSEPKRKKKKHKQREES